MYDSPYKRHSQIIMESVWSSSGCSAALRTPSEQQQKQQQFLLPDSGHLIILCVQRTLLTAFKLFTSWVPELASLYLDLLVIQQTYKWVKLFFVCVFFLHSRHWQVVSFPFDIQRLCIGENMNCFVNGLSGIKCFALFTQQPGHDFSWRTTSALAALLNFELHRLQRAWSACAQLHSTESKSLLFHEATGGH